MEKLSHLEVRIQQMANMEVGRGRGWFQKLSQEWKTHTWEWRDSFTEDFIQRPPVELEGGHTDSWRKEDVRITYRQKIYGIKRKQVLLLTTIICQQYTNFQWHGIGTQMREEQFCVVMNATECQHHVTAQTLTKFNKFIHKLIFS